MPLRFTDLNKPGALAHDLLPEPPPPRPPLPRWGRYAVILYFVLLLAVLGVVVVNVVTASSREKQAYDLSRQRDQVTQEITRKEGEIKGFTADTIRAEEISTWVRNNYHLQKLLIGILTSFSDEVIVESVQGRSPDGQLQLELQLTLDGRPEAQIEAMSSLETSLFAMGIQITTREVPTMGMAGRGSSYRMTLLLPDPVPVRPGVEGGAR